MIAFLRILILLGSIQGVIVSCLLWFSKKNRRSTRILGALILLMSLASFNLYANEMNWFGGLADLIPLVIVMPMGPLIWFYIQASLDPAFVMGKRERRQFYPVLIDLVPSLTIITAILGLLLHVFTKMPGNAWGTFIDTWNVYADIPRWISITVYLWLAHRYLAAYQAATNIAWLRLFIRIFLVFQCIWLLYLVPYVIPRYTDTMLSTFNWYPVYIPLAVMIYWLGIKGYIIAQQAQDAPVTKTPGILTIPGDTIQYTVIALQRTMQEDQYYLQPGLTLKMVADHISVPPKTISAILNQRLDTSFNEFVNGYRIEAFKEKILDPQMAHLTIAGVATECGFNSQATFQRTFKQVTGMSPTAFRDTAQIRI